MREEEIRRYNRHLRQPEIGLEGQEKLKRARVAVVGAGGLGCPVLQYLVAAGVGTLGIIDGDVVEESNLQRQVLFSYDHLGQKKAQVAVNVLSRQNPFCQLVAHSIFLDRSNALDLLSNYDLVIDGSDNFATRYLVNDACVILGKPLIFGSIYKFEGQISVFNHHGGPTYRCLYPDPSELESCAEIGVLGVLPGITGCLMANETIKLITGIGELLSGKVLVFNALSLSFNAFSFALNPANRQISQLPEEAASCSNEIPEISAAEWQFWQLEQDVLLVDVREPAEYERENLGGQLIPLAQLLREPEIIPKDQRVVVHCQSGGRSRKAVEFLLSEGYAQVYNLRGGLDSFELS